MTYQLNFTDETATELITVELQAEGTAEAVQQILDREPTTGGWALFRKGRSMTQVADGIGGEVRAMKRKVLAV